MADIKRTDFNYNFLKQIIFRIDFKCVFQREMEEIINKIMPVVNEFGFLKCEQNEDNNLSPNGYILDANKTSPDDRLEQKIYSFLNPDFGYELKLSNSFICFIIKATSYAPFENYSNIVLRLVEVYKNTIDFIKIERIGIRKINVCMLENIEKLNYYFSPNYFSYSNILDTIDKKASYKEDIFTCDKYNGTIKSEIEQGVSDSKLLYRVSLDADLYSNNITNLEDIDFDLMNNILFKIYIDSLTDEFKRELCGTDDTVFEGIIGVERNE